MDQNLKSVIEKKVNRTIESLKSNNINGYFVKDAFELHNLVDDLVKDKQTVTVGGSMTLFETGTIEYLKERDLNFLNRYEEGLSPDAIEDIFKKSFAADAYFTSTNAVTLNGELYNVDGKGNRVAAMIYGPDKVIVIAGTNKIVPTIDDAIKRNREIAAPANVLRLNKNTPCKITGSCSDCNSPDRICNAYTIISRQFDKERMHVIFINNEYGY